MGWRWRTFSRYSTGAAPTRCVGESGVTQLGVLGLELAQLVEQRVVDVVVDAGVVEDVVAIVVLVELLAELGGAALAPTSSPRPSLHLAGGRAQQAREVVQAQRVHAGAVGEIEMDGVTAIRPSATAARSVPSSWW